jgi:hypothetical protein
MDAQARSAAHCSGLIADKPFVFHAEFQCGRAERSDIDAITQACGQAGPAVARNQASHARPALFDALPGMRPDFS